MKASIHYSGIARNSYIVADYSVLDEDFKEEFQQVLLMMKSYPGTTSVNKKKHKYFTRSAVGYDFGCVCSDPLQEDVAKEFLDKLQKELQDYTAKSNEEGSSAANLTKIIRGLIVFSFNI